MHGTVRIVLELSGETIVKTDVQIGYLHRGFEKMVAERGTWAAGLPVARIDRLNFLRLADAGQRGATRSPSRKLCGLAGAGRCQWYRMALGELARISDHLTCDGAMAMELGAFTPFLWFVKAREMVWDILEEETGARLTHSFGRIGGMAKPPSKDFKAICHAALTKILELVEEGERMLLKNRIFIDRLENVGTMPAADAIALGWTGPCLRATGVAYDIRKAHPYLKYWAGSISTSPSGTKGRHARPLPRARSVRSARAKRIIEQSLEPHAHLMSRPVNCDAPASSCSRTRRASTRRSEATIQHFKLTDHGRREGPRREGVLVHRGRQRRARRLLPRVRRKRRAVPRPHPTAVLPDHRPGLSKNSSKGRKLLQRHRAHVPGR